MTDNKPYAAHTAQHAGWNIFIECGDLGAERLTDITRDTEEEAWEQWEVCKQRESLNIRNYGFI